FRVSLAHGSVRDAALRIAWGFRSLYNVPEVMSLLRGSLGQDDEVYWRRAAMEGLHGNLQAVLDEFAHLLPEWLGLAGGNPDQIARQIGAAIHDAVAIRAVNYSLDDVQVDDDQITLSTLHMRVRFALRFGRDMTDNQQVLQRSTAVRAAFNSPFWPFVLASTSVGQEGLDFHQYCHAVVHWNLPANPVDLEQREGRVHRYKGHAIRKNVAERHRAAAFERRDRDPWAAMFAEAVRGSRGRELRDIEPYWVYEGAAHIERHIPMLPLSREVEQRARLQRSLAAYRLVFGQARQEDLVAYLQDHVSPEALVDLAQRLRINLTPK
ncbi:MAG TPA: helicase-related protein, partial [Thermomicrobiales bacterium]|nr:helicase-related protein [Thermomicrobiales bacterium]